jgi:hypothetical protein
MKDEAMAIDLSSGYATGGGIGHIYRDGLAVEINTPAGYCRAYQWGSVLECVKQGMEESGANRNNVFATLEPIANINLAALKGYPDDLKELGCLPSHNAYTKKQTKMTMNAKTAPFRTAGGHMHVTSFENAQIDNKDYMCTFTKLCDLLIGLPSVVLFGDDMEFQRRELYGKAGEFRIKDHSVQGATKPLWGHEYRVMSPRMWRHPAIASLCLGVYRDVIHKYKDVLIPEWNDSINEPLQKAINTGKGAVELLEEWEKVVAPYDELLRREERKTKKTLTYGTMWTLTTEAILKAKEETQKVGDNFPTYSQYGNGHHCGWNDCMKKWGIYAPPE